MKTTKNAVLVVAVVIFVRVLWVAIEEKNFVVAAPLSLIFLVLSYLGDGLKVKSFSFDADDHKISVNETEVKPNAPKN